MDFALDEAQQLLANTTRRFLEADNALGAVRSRLETESLVDRAQWKAGSELGWASMMVPESAGGGSVTGQPLVDLAVLAGELGRVLHPAPFLPTNVVADAMVQAGADRFGSQLSSIVGGGSLAAWCLSADGNVNGERITARSEGDRFRLSGTARFVHGAEVADILLVEAAGADGALRVLVEASAPGVTVRVMCGLDLTRRVCEVSFDEVDVGADAVVATGPGADFGRQRSLAVAAVVQAAEGAGAAERLLSETVRYAKDRVQFGRPIGSFQAIKHRLADLHITVEGMRAAAFYAALAFGDGFDDADEAVAVAGSWVPDAYAGVCGEALQLHGGIAFTWEHDVHLYVRRAKLDQVMYGQSWEHREVLCRLVSDGRRVDD